MESTVGVVADVVRISTTSGAVDVTAEPGRTEVWSSTGPVTVVGSAATIDDRSGRVRVLVPEGIDAVIGTTSGRVTVSGRLGDVSVLTKSGRISVEEAATVDARTRTGKITVGRTSGLCRVAAASGRVDVGSCGTAEVTVTSGRIDLRDVHGSARAHCTSGKVGVHLAGPHDVDAETVSGRISVSLPAGVRARVVSSPDDRADAADRVDADCVVRARSTSGRVVVTNR